MVAMGTTKNTVMQQLQLMAIVVATVRGVKTVYAKDPVAMDTTKKKLLCSNYS